MSSRVLIADDDPDVRLIVGKALRDAGFDTEDAESGTDALTKLESKSFGVVILDLVMSRGSGKDVLVFLRTLHDPPHCIVISALADEWSRRRTEENCLVLPKPLDLSLLLVAVRRALTGSLV